MVYLGVKFSGLGPIFAEVGPFHYLIPGNLMVGYLTLALASGISWLLFPNLLTGLLSSRSEDVIRRNSVFLPLYQVWLVFLAIMGLVTLAKGLMPSKVSRLAFPSVLYAYFNSTFTALAFAGIVVGSMVPAALQSLGAANLVTRNGYLQFISRGPASRSRSSGAGSQCSSL